MHTVPLAENQHPCLGKGLCIFNEVSTLGKVIMENQPENPFRPPIHEQLDSLKGINFTYPYLPEVIYTIVLLFVLILLFAFFITIGISAQIFIILGLAAIDSLNEAQEAEKKIESFSHGVAAGVFIITSVPFFIIIFPAYIVGWIVKFITDFLHQVLKIRN